MEGIVGLATMVVAFGALTWFFVWLDRWASRAEPGLRTFRGDVREAFATKGSFRAATAALQAAPLPLLIGGWLMVILDPGGNGGTGGSSASDGSEITLFEGVPLTWIVIGASVVGLASLVFVALFLAFAMTDTREYRPELDPGDAPLVVEELEKVSTP